MISIASEPAQLRNAASHILHATVTPDQPVRVRRHRIMAAAGELEYRRQVDEHDTEPTDTVEDRSAIFRLRDTQIVKTITRRIKPEVKISALTAGNLVLDHATGTGDIYLGHHGGDITVFELHDEQLVVFNQNEILAHSDSITATLEPIVGTELGLVLESRHAWVFTGSGEFATATSGEVIVLNVTNDQPVVVEAEALLARTAKIALARPDDYTGRLIGRTIAQGAKYLPYDIDLGRAKVWLNATGTGQVVIRSSD